MMHCVWVRLRLEANSATLDVMDALLADQLGRGAAKRDCSTRRQSAKVDAATELKMHDNVVGGRDRPDFGTVRPRVQIPGPRPKSEYDHQRYGPRSQGGGSQPDHNFLERHFDARPEAILKFDWNRVGELPHKFTITAICVEGKEL